MPGNVCPCSEHDHQNKCNHKREVAQNYFELPEAKSQGLITTLNNCQLKYFSNKNNDQKISPEMNILRTRDEGRKSQPQVRHV